MSLVNTLRSTFGFRLRLGKNQISTVVPPPGDYESEQSTVSPDDDDDYDSEPESDDEGDLFVWDNPNPFAPPDPSQAYLHSLIQAQITEMRRYESIGPFQSLPDLVQLDHWDESDPEDEDEDYDDEDSENDDDGDSDDEDGDDGDDEDSSGEDSDDDASDGDDKPNVIVLPKLLPIPLRFFPSPPPHPNHSPLPPPPPSTLRSTSSSTPSTDDEDSTLWADLAQVYNDIAEAEERAARKAKRDAHRSRLKALAILGPEASPAI